MSGSLPGSSLGSQTNKHTVEINGIPLQLRGPIQTEIINIAGRKVNIGEAGPDSHPVNSSVIQTSWQGGGQVWAVNPAQDMQRFWWAQAMTEYPEYMTLPPYTSTYTVGANAFVIGDYPNDDSAKLYGYANGNLVVYDAVGNDWDIVDNLTAVPVGTGTQYTIQTGGSAGTSLLYIPEGTQYETFNGTVVAAPVASSAISFAIWDNKLFRLQTNGALYWTTDGSTWFLVGQVPDGSIPRRLVSFINRQDAPTIYVATNYFTWALNFDSQVLVQTKLYNPRHPLAGMGAVTHQGDFYLSAGLGVDRYNLQTIAPTGIDRDQGVPIEYRGYIVALETSYNGLFALVRGTDTGSSGTETETLDTGSGDDPMYASTVQSNSVLMVWNGDGWHYRWHGTSGTPTNLFISQADRKYKVVWAVGDQLLSQNLPYTYFNPRDPENALFEFADYGQFETGWNNWGWPGIRKLLKKIELGIKNASATEVIEVYYKIDDDDNDWVLVGVINEPRNYEFFLGLDIENPVMPDGSPRYKGINHERVRLMLKMYRGTNKQAKPVVHWYSLIGRKIMRPQRSWRFVADMTQQVRNWPPGFLTHLIEELPVVGYAVPFKYRDKMYMVDVVAVNGPDDMEGKERRSYRTIHLLESNEMQVSDHEHGKV